MVRGHFSESQERLMSVYKKSSSPSKGTGEQVNQVLL